MLRLLTSWAVGPRDWSLSLCRDRTYGIDARLMVLIAMLNNTLNYLCDARYSKVLLRATPKV